MSISEEQLRAAIAEVAAEITEDSVPPLSLPAAQRRGGPAARRVAEGRRLRVAGLPPGWPRLLAPLAAAAAIIAVVVASVTVAAHRGTFSAPRPAPQVPGFGLHSAPPYYLALVWDGNVTGQARYHAVIRGTVTGATEATIRPPKPFSTFTAVTAAADDRTFVLAAQAIGGSRSGASEPSVKLFAVHFSPARAAVTTRPLPIPELASTSLVDGLALSPDGSRLAIAGVPSLPPGPTQLRVYSLATGAAQVWQSPGDFGYLPLDDPEQSLSWSADGRTLAFNWRGAVQYVKGNRVCGTSAAGLWLLDTASAGGSLLADSRLAVPWSLVGGLGFSRSAVLSPDAAMVIAPVWGSVPALPKCPESEASPPAGPAINPASTYEFEEFSARTGKPVYYLYPRHSRQLVASGDVVLWSSHSGSVLVVIAGPLSNPVTGVLSGGKFIPIPGAPANPANPQVAF